MAPPSEAQYVGVSLEAGTQAESKELERREEGKEAVGPGHTASKHPTAYCYFLAAISCLNSCNLGWVPSRPWALHHGQCFACASPIASCQRRVLMPEGVVGMILHTHGLHIANRLAPTLCLTIPV